MFRSLMQKLRGQNEEAKEASEAIHEERLEVGETGPAGIMPDGDVPDWTADEEAPADPAP
jgi:hypothetical protein